MKKLLAIMTAVLLALSNSAFAAGVAMSDKEMDEVAAGDWVVLQPGETVEDVYYTNNNLELKDDSQTSLQAVSNANSVDSANAVQSNISSVTGDFPVMANSNQKNEAHVTNYNPSDAGSSYEKTSLEVEASAKTTNDVRKSSSFDLDYKSGSSYKKDETLDVVESLNITDAKASASETDCKDCDTESVSTSAFLLDYDYNLDYDKHVVKESHADFDLEKSKSFVKHEESELTEKLSEKCESKSSYRKSLSKNNHIDLKDQSQQFTQAVSNLNSVASGAAVQTNIASNVGLSGTISGTNIASVSNAF